MARTVGIGKQNFQDVREKNCFYVDKTHFIKAWWESEDDITLITRPRRFGKTLNLSMIECFFSVKYAQRPDLFEGLTIWEEEKYRALQGTVPVIFLSFADIKEQKNLRDALRRINITITQAYRKHSYLIKEEELDEKEKQEYLKIDSDMDGVTAVCSIQNLCTWLERYYGKKPIILLDEYDTPMQEAWIGGYWDEMTAFYRNFFNSTFKTNPSLGRALMTGITRISKESIFSDLNNLAVVTTTTKQYQTAFGFTEEEVIASLDEQGLSGKQSEVKRWYDGFIFGGVEGIYNPWSIINFLKYKEIDTYWTNTSSNALVNHLIKTGNAEVKVSMEKLLQGENLVTAIDEQIVFDQLEESEESIWSLLLASGYLKALDDPKIKEENTFEDRQYTLALTNNEVKRMFVGFIRDWFSGDDAVSAVYNEFTRALLACDIDAMNYFLNEVMKKTFSYFDTGAGASDTSEPERFYHGFVLGLMVDLQGRYRLTSNRESGYGRYDVMLEPLNGDDPAFILEFKVCIAHFESSLEETLASAKAQIKEKDYAANLLAGGMAPERIHEFGFAFQGKQVLIG